MIKPAIFHMGRQQINEVARIALGDPSVIPLWFGESDLVTPDFIREAAKRALDDGRTFYDHPQGTTALRHGLQAYLRRVHGVDIAEPRIIVPGSAMLSIAMAISMLIDPGDNLIVISPVWPNIVLSLEARGAHPRHVRLDDSTGVWKLDLAKVEAAIDDRTRGVFLASPNNPTGWIMPREQQKQLLELTRAKGIGLIADEVYTRIVYDGGAAPSFLEIAKDDDVVFVINSFSKAWAMTGWRIGWMIAPAFAFEAIVTLSGIENTGATTFAQYGALAALEHGETFIAQMVARCSTGRDICRARLSQLKGVKWIEPEGAFYGYFALEGLKDPLAYAQDLVRRAGVGLAPGSAFGPGNESYLRLCYAQSPERLTAALDRLVRALDT